MDTDCVICYGSHHPADCKERTEQHCPECHALILEVADHTTVCASKTWIYKKYANLYAQPLKERLIISTSSPFRYLKNTCWQKPEDQLEMYSPGNGAFIQFKSERDISLSTTCFAPIQIVVVVKHEDGNADIFAEKLLLSTTKKVVLIAAGQSKRFDRNAPQIHDTTLILAVSAKDEPCLNINVFPSNSPAREYWLRFDKANRMFRIPSGLLAGLADPNNIYQLDETVLPQLDHHLNTNQQLVRSCDVSNIGIGNVACASPTVYVPRYDNCFECHAPIKSAKDHLPTCGAKNRFVSKLASAYVKNPVTRCELIFKSPLMVHHNGNAINVQAGMKYFSSMADAYFKFESSTKVILLTTGFTRIRLPLVTAVKIGSTTMYMEKLILMTSQDRTIVVAHSSRQVDGSNVLNEFEHNTPLVLITSSEEDPTLTVNIHSAGPVVDEYEIVYRQRDQKFVVPAALDVKSRTFVSKSFDTKILAKKAKY